MIQLVWLCKVASLYKLDVQIFVWYNFWKMEWIQFLPTCMKEIDQSIHVPKLQFVFLRNWNEKCRKLRNTAAWSWLQKSKKLSFYSNISLFLFKVSLKIELWVYKFYFRFLQKLKEKNKSRNYNMFNLCKSCYQAILPKQRWNDLN